MFTRDTLPLEALEGLEVTVMGLGLFGGGKGVTEFLLRHGARVTVTDKRSAEVLAPAMDSLRAAPIRWVLGEHREQDFLGADLVIASPGVPRESPLLALSRARGVPLETEMNLFFKYCPAKIAAVTGSNGKTTTTALLGEMARVRRADTRVGGNIGLSLLSEVESLRPEEWVILELSSFQIEDLADIDRRPEVSVVTNLSPNHLDRHGSYEAYVAAKRHLVEPGPEPNTAVLNGEDTLIRSWADAFSGSAQARRVVYFGRAGSVLPRAEGVWYDEAEQRVFHASARGHRELLFERSDLVLPGRFNVLNAAAAAGAAIAMGLGRAEILPAVKAFRGLEHRLEKVAEIDGVSYVNDSIATTPESTLAALEAHGPNAVVICGGSSKGTSFQALGKALARRARAVVLMGQTADAIDHAIPRGDGSAVVVRAEGLRDAVDRARALAQPGDHVLLSPACASFDMFVNFADRGTKFKDIVRSLLPRESTSS